MELQEFIKETLVQITNAVKEAQVELKDTGCLINPYGYVQGSSQFQEGGDGDFRSVQNVKMHVAVSVNEDKGSSSKLGVAKILNAGFDNKESSANHQMTTIEFEIPLALPAQEI